jgi:protein SCO1/2
MAAKQKTKFSLIALLSVGFILIPQWVRAQSNEGIPREAEGVGVDQKLGAVISGDLAFRNEKGQTVYLGQFFEENRPVLLSLNYSNCPMLCSVQLNQLVMGLEQLELTPGVDFQVISVSIDPKETSEKAAETKAKYLAMMRREGYADAWHFLTGDVKAIKQLAEEVGFRYRLDRATGEYYHPAMLAFVSPERKITSYQLAVDYPSQQLKLGLMDAADGKIGSIIDTLPLLCFVYDAERGSYVMSAWKLMRLGGGLTVIGLFAALLPYWLGRRGEVSKLAPTSVSRSEGNPHEMNNDSKT